MTNYLLFRAVGRSENPEEWVVKSDNLQYDMLVRWDKWLVDKASDVPSIIFFFTISCKIPCKNGFNLFFYFFFYKFTKIKIKSFECPKSIRNYKKNNAWNIRCLVDESFVPSTQRASVLYWRLLDLYRLHKGVWSF